MTRFDGFAPQVHEWFEGLEADNSKEYFAATRAFFEDAIRGQMEALLTELSEEFGGEVKMFRQHRDIRFSADKSPYKTNTYGVLRGTELVARAETAGLDVWGESLATAPRGSAKDHERIELLRRKSLSLGAMVDSEPGISRSDGLRFVTQTWRAAAPVTGWLDEHVGPTTMPADSRYRRR
jgi:chromosomal replication initiation ATPase DnaA